MKTSIVIPNWNGEEKLKRNLPRVLEVKDVEEVIVVDDGSTDGSVKFIEEEFSGVKLIKKSKNEGYGSTVNLGVSQAKGVLVFLLNTDAVPEKECVEKALPYFKDEKVFSVSCDTGGSWSWAKFKDGFFWHYMDKSQESRIKNQDVHQTLWASGGSGIFRKSIWDKLGGFDPMYDPFYEEDADLGYRATKRGFINLWVSDVRVEHYKEQGVIAQNFSKKKINSIAQRNQLLFIWKNITSKKLIKQHKIGLIKHLLVNPSYLFVVLAAWSKLSEVSKMRKFEEREEVVKDEEILEKFNS